MIFTLQKLYLSTYSHKPPTGPYHEAYDYKNNLNIILHYTGWLQTVITLL